MPSPRVLNLNPVARTEETPLEKLIGGYTKARGERETAEKESDALKKQYGQFMKDGQNIQKAIFDIQSDVDIGPTAKVNSMKNLLEFQEHNAKIQKKAEEDHEKALKKENNEKITRDLEQKRGLPEGSLAPYVDNPKLAEQITRPPNEGKKTQASQPIDPDQLRRLKEVRNRAEFKNASPAQRYQMFTDNGVSRENAEAESDIYAKEEENRLKNEKYNKEFQYQIHKDTKDYDETILKDAKGAQHQLDAIKDVKGAIEKVKPSQLANLFRFFGDTGRKISDAILTGDQATIQSSIPAFLEGRKELFGVRLSDADLRLLSDKLPDMGKSLQANKQILKLMERYSQKAILKARIAKEIKAKNQGLRGLEYVNEVEDRFEEMTKTVKIVSPKTGKKIDIPAYQLSEALESGATLANE